MPSIHWCNRADQILTYDRHMLIILVLSYQIATVLIFWKNKYQTKDFSSTLVGRNKNWICFVCKKSSFTIIWYFKISSHILGQISRVLRSRTVCQKSSVQKQSSPWLGLWWRLLSFEMIKSRWADIKDNMKIKCQN